MESRAEREAEIKSYVRKVEAILLDASTSIRNAELITSYRQKLPAGHGFHLSLHHVYRTQRFHAVTQLAKLLSMAKGDAYSFEKISNKLLDPKFIEFTESHKRSQGDRKQRISATRKSIEEHCALLKSQENVINRIRAQRDKWYAHTDLDDRVYGIPNEMLAPCLEVIQQVANKLVGEITGAHFMYNVSMSTVGGLFIYLDEGIDSFDKKSILLG